MQLLFIV